MSDTSATDPAATAKQQRDLSTEYLSKQPIIEWAKGETVSRVKRTRDKETGEMSEITEDTRPNVSADLYVPIDRWISNVLKMYSNELANWNYAPSRTTPKPFVQLRVTRVEKMLRENYPAISAAGRQRVIYNICNLISGSIVQACHNLSEYGNGITIFSRYVMPSLRLYREYVLKPMKNGFMTSEEEAELYDGSKKPARKAKRPAEEAEATEVKPTAKRAKTSSSSSKEEPAAEPTAVAKIAPKRAAEAAVVSKKDNSAPPPIQAKAVEQPPPPAPAAKVPAGRPGTKRGAPSATAPAKKKQKTTTTTTPIQLQPDDDFSTPLQGYDEDE